MRNLKNFNAKELALRHVKLMDEKERIEKEIAAVEKELKKILIKHMIKNPFPITKKEDT